MIDSKLHILVSNVDHWRKSSIFYCSSICSPQQMPLPISPHILPEGSLSLLPSLFALLEFSSKRESLQNWISRNLWSRKLKSIQENMMVRLFSNFVIRSFTDGMDLKFDGHPWCKNNNINLNNLLLNVKCYKVLCARDLLCVNHYIWILFEFKSTIIIYQLSIRHLFQIIKFQILCQMINYKIQINDKI